MTGDERLSQAVAMRTARVDWDVIADRCGYESPAAACLDVSGELDRRRDALTVPPDEMRQQMIMSLDRMMAAVSGRALRGDVESVTIFAQLAAQVCALQGIEPAAAPSTGAFVDAVTKGTRREQLEALRDKLAIMIGSTQDGSRVASLSLRLVKILEELERIPEDGQRSAYDELAARRTGGDKTGGRRQGGRRR